MFSVRTSDYSYGTHRLHVASNSTWDRALYFATAPPFLYTRPSASSNAPRRRPAPSETNDFVLDFTITYPTKIRSSRMPLGVRFRRMCGRLRRKKESNAAAFGEKSPDSRQNDDGAQLRSSRSRSIDDSCCKCRGLLYDMF